MKPAAVAILERNHAVIQPTPDVLPLIEVKGKYVAVLHVTCCRE